MEEESVHGPTLIAIAWTAYALSIGLHEGGHAFVGWLVGGIPTFLSTTDVKGDWSALSPAAFSAVGLAGVGAHLLLAGAGALLLTPMRGHSVSLRVFGWLLFAINGLIPSMYMLVSPLFGFGDWNTILQRLGMHPVVRLLLAALGAAWSLLWFHLTTRTLGRLLAGVHPETAKTLARSLARTSWISGGSLAVGSALLSPLAWWWTLPIAAGSTFGSTWPLLLAADRVVSLPARDATPAWRGLRPVPLWLFVGGTMCVGFLLIGRGIHL